MAQKRKSVSKQINKPKKATRSAQELEAQVSGAIMEKNALASGELPVIEPVKPSDLPAQPDFIDDLRDAAIANPAPRQAPISTEQVKDPVQTSTPRVKRSGKKKRKGLWWKIAVAVIVVCLVGSCAIIGWDRWMRYDDAADFQGKWLDANSSLPITIDSEEISISDEVAYPYELDTWAKTVSYNFSQLEGGAMYVFSDDRQTLYIVEGEQRDIVTDTLRLVGLAELPDYSASPNATVLVKGTAAVNSIAQKEATQQSTQDAAAIAALAGSADE